MGGGVLGTGAGTGTGAAATCCGCGGAAGAGAVFVAALICEGVLLCVRIRDELWLRVGCSTRPQHGTPRTRRIAQRKFREASGKCQACFERYWCKSYRRDEKGGLF